MDRSFVVGRAGPVRGTNLAEDSSGFGHYIGDAKGAADLNQFTPRYDDFTPFRQGVQGQEYSRSIVIDQDGRDVLSPESLFARLILFALPGGSGWVGCGPQTRCGHSYGRQTIRPK